MTEATSCKGFSVTGANCFVWVSVRMMRLAVMCLFLMYVFEPPKSGNPNQHVNLLGDDCPIVIYSIYFYIFRRVWT